MPRHGFLPFTSLVWVEMEVWALCVSMVLNGYTRIPDGWPMVRAHGLD